MNAKQPGKNGVHHVTKGNVQANSNAYYIRKECVDRPKNGNIQTVFHVITCY